MVIYNKFINIEILDFATFTQMLNIELQCNVGNMRGKNYLVYIYVYVLKSVQRKQLATLMPPYSVDTCTRREPIF